MDNKTINMTPDNRQSAHFGAIDVTIHYTLGAGLAEQLGEKVEQAVLVATSKIGGPDRQFLFDGAFIRMEWFWHRHDTPLDQPDSALSLHISNDRKDNGSYSVDWDYF